MAYRRPVRLAGSLAVVLLAGCHAARPPSAPVQRGRVVATYPQSPEAFVEGLEIHDGLLYESTGLRGRSTLRIVSLESGILRVLHPLPDDLYAEGLTIFRGRVYQMTYQAHRCFTYEPRTLAPIGEQTYDGEAWGLAHDEESLVLSDGTSVLRFLDPETLAVVRTLEVRDGETPIVRLNELEWVEGEIWANVWMTDRIARIDPASGRVLGWIDLAFLRESLGLTEEQAVLNGIAYDAGTGRLYVTGKLWPELYELALPP